MKETSIYRYQERIKELERDNFRLREYKSVVYRIFDAIATNVSENKTTSQGWILHQIKSNLLK